VDLNREVNFTIVVKCLREGRIQSVTLLDLYANVEEITRVMICDIWYREYSVWRITFFERCRDSKSFRECYWNRF